LPIALAERRAKPRTSATARATISGATVSGAANNRNGKDTTEAELQQRSTYEAIGWNFSTVWKWNESLKRPVLLGAPEEGAGLSEPTTIQVAKGSASFTASATTPISSDAVIDRVQGEFAGTDAELISTNLSAEQEQKLRDAFGDDD